MSLHEECGVFGIFSPHAQAVAPIVYYGLYALQHRGQDSCGIVTNEDGLFFSHKDIGLVSEVFSQRTLSAFPAGHIAVGHVRYGTTGSSTRANCQPIEVNHRKGKLALCHNGNLSNALALRDRLETAGAIFHSTSDTEIIAYLITQERLRCASIEAALSAAMKHLEGAYSLVLMSSAKLLAARDPLGFRPLCYGQTEDGSYVVASESCALDAVGAKLIRDLEPGEILVLDQDGVHTYPASCGSAQRCACAFEYIYFARPDSVIDGVSVHAARMRAGEILARTFPTEGDVVIGVPDSGLDAALGYARASGIPYGMGLIKNKYIGRTFIAPEPNHRLDQVKIKLSPIKSALQDKRVVLIDDSIVRGSTSKRIAALLRQAGAKEIHLRISAPPFTHPCYYGTDIDSQECLIAVKHDTEEIAALLGVDSLGYLPLTALREMCGRSDLCSACFDGRYPTTIPTDARKDRYERRLSEKTD
jgi:amidophosphoribosyltransferase